ncbi:hypothetical protein [Mesorhizobium sp. ORS 3428]|uniref:hypothetical protein n=1 Tax=Mesorhizobium sp. ORS 3428 TaxID=540997 RepID=UPI0026B86F3D
MKVIQALNEVGVELIGENRASERGGRGVRLKATAAQSPQAEPQNVATSGIKPAPPWRIFPLQKNCHRHCHTTTGYPVIAAGGDICVFFC